MLWTATSPNSNRPTHSRSIPGFWYWCCACCVLSWKKPHALPLTGWPYSVFSSRHVSFSSGFWRRIAVFFAGTNGHAGSNLCRATAGQSSSSIHPSRPISPAPCPASPNRQYAATVGWLPNQRTSLSNAYCRYITLDSHPQKRKHGFPWASGPVTHVQWYSAG